jgi:hypothetical protein
MVATHEDYPLSAYAERALLERYALATPDEIRRGREWYDAARRECRAMAREYGQPLSRVAGILAVTSPDAQLAANLRWTREILAGERTAGRYPSDQAPKVAAILAAHPSKVRQLVTGPKVSAFYAAIMGDADVLVIDRWASYAAGGPKDRVPGVRAKRAFAAAYRAAAASVGETVRDFQAIVWIQARESTPVVRRGRTLIPKLADITA